MHPNTLDTTTGIASGTVPLAFLPGARIVYGPEGEGGGEGGGGGQGGGEQLQLDPNNPQVKAFLEKYVGDATKDLRAKVDEFRTNNIDLTKLIDSIGGKDKVAELQALQTQIENDEVLQLFTSGKREEYDNRITGRMQETHTREVQALTTDRDTWRSKAEELQGIITQNKISGAIGDAMREARVDPDYFDAVQQLVVGRVKLADDGAMIVMGDDGNELYGKQGKLMTVQEHVEALREKKPKLFLTSTGGGASGGGVLPNGRGQFSISAEDAKNPLKYRQVKDAATKAGQDVNIVH